MSGTNSGGQTGKVRRVIEEYSLDGVGDEMERRWTGRQGERESLRTLADRFNKIVLKKVLVRAGFSPLEGEVEQMYELLQKDDAGPGERTEVRRRLEREDIDVSELQSDFVSHQSMHTYLQKHRGAELEKKNEDMKRAEVRTIRQMQGRTAAVTENSLERLSSADEIVVDEFEVFTSVQIYCEDCNTQYDVVNFIQQGGCDCAS